MDTLVCDCVRVFFDDNGKSSPISTSVCDFMFCVVTDMEYRRMIPALKGQCKCCYWCFSQPCSYDPLMTLPTLFSHPPASTDSSAEYILIMWSPVSPLTPTHILTHIQSGWILVAHPPPPPAPAGENTVWDWKRLSYLPTNQTSPLAWGHTVLQLTCMVAQWSSLWSVTCYLFICGMI